MDKVVYDRIEDLMAKADEIKLAVDEFGEMLEDIQTFTNETNVVVKDILNGRQLSEWIADLAASGKSSATYADTSRMQALIEDTDACKNVQVSQHIFDWGVTNNKVGVFLNSCFGTVSGISWNEISTPSQASSNSSAFQKIASDGPCFSVFFMNSIAKQSLWDNFLVTEPHIHSSPQAIDVLSKFMAQKSNGATYGPTVNFSFDGEKVFVLSADRGTSCTLTRPNETQITENNIAAINRFGKSASVYVQGADGPVVTIRYVDFS